MINTLLIDKEEVSLRDLKGQLNSYCPQVAIRGIATSSAEAARAIPELRPELIFLEVAMLPDLEAPLSEHAPCLFETIFVSSSPECTMEKTPFPGSGYLTKLVDAEKLLAAVHNAQHWIQIRQELASALGLLGQLLGQHSPGNIIAIPTMEGIEFVRAQEVVRCEGLQRFTRIFVDGEESIISSFNIGEFRKRLTPFGFFQPHKSHLVNLRYIRRFLIEGTLVMQDGSFVPVSRRRRSVFLEWAREL